MTDTPPTFVHDHNRQAWDARVRRREVFARSALDEGFDQRLALFRHSGAVCVRADGLIG